MTFWVDNGLPIRGPWALRWRLWLTQQIEDRRNAQVGKDTSRAEISNLPDGVTCRSGTAAAPDARAMLRRVRTEAEYGCSID
jgi:hypothetical protein